jgi:hypothetical protein
LEPHASIPGSAGGLFFGFRLVEHGLAEIQAENGGLGREPTSEGEGHIAAARRQIEHVARPHAAHGRHELPPPPQVDATAQTTVGHIVPAGDPGEHGVDGNGVGHTALKGSAFRLGASVKLRSNNLRKNTHDNYQ